MKILTLKQNAEIHMGYCKFHHKLGAGIEYVIFDKFFDTLQGMNDVLLVRDLEDEVPLYRGEDLAGRSLLFTTMGGYGDGLSAIQALNTLQNRYPTAQIDLMVHLDMFFLLKHFSFQGDWVEYPVSLDYFERYDFYQTSESVYGFENYYRRNVARMFCELFSVPMDLRHTVFRPRGVTHVFSSEENAGKRVAIQVDAMSGNTRFYPIHRVMELAEGLSAKDFHVYLVGFLDSPPRFDPSANIHNFINRLSSVTDVAGLLSRMDVIVAPDSVGGHLGGLLNIPTVALFSVTGTDKMDQLSSVYGMQPELSCSPCYQLYRCPLGRGRCDAMEHASMSPERIIQKVLEMAG